MKRVPEVGGEATVIYLNARESAVVESVETAAALTVVTEQAEVLASA